MIALEKILQQEGLGSRRECRAFITQGTIYVNGQLETHPERTFPRDGLTLTRLTHSEPETWISAHRIVLMLHKPVGYECSHAPSHHPSIMQLLPSRVRQRGVQMVGRLDHDTSGLLILTNDGSLNHALTSPRRHVPKCYRVTTARPITDKHIQQLNQGVILRDDPTPVKSHHTERLSPHQLRLTLHEGRYHQVKRMLAAVGNHVEQLHRESIGKLSLPDTLTVGTWRPLTADECEQLTQE